MSNRAERIERSKQRALARKKALQQSIKNQNAALRAEQKKQHEKRLRTIAKFMDQLGLFGYDDATLKYALMLTAERIESWVPQDQDTAPTDDESNLTETLTAVSA